MKITTTLILSICFATLCFADAYSGKLVNATCEKDQPNTCELTETASAFALQTSDGGVLKLDATGNEQAAQLAKQDLAKAKEGQFTIDGEKAGDTLKVVSIKPAEGQ